MAGRKRRSEQAENLDEDIRNTIADLTEHDVRPVNEETTKGFVVLMWQYLRATYDGKPRYLLAFAFILVVLMALIGAGVVALSDDEVEAADAPAVSVEPVSTSDDGAAAASSTALPESTTAATAVATTVAPSTTAPPPPAATTTTVRSTIRLPIGLPADPAVIASHQGQLIWNRTAANVTHENVTWWLSQVFARSEAPGGWISVDLEALTVSGVISESWKCANNCKNERWSVLDTGWTATIVDGALEPDGAGWLVSGTVDIRYHAEGGYQETGQAVCGGTCEIKGIGSATVPLHGVVIGGQVELQFADGIVGYLADMDFTGLEKTPFWMSRFSQTWNVDLG